MSDVCLREGTSYEKSILCQTTFQSACAAGTLYFFTRNFWTSRFSNAWEKTAQSPNRSQYSHEDGRFNRIIRGVAVVNSPSIQHDLCPIPVTPPCVTKACRPSSQTTFCCQRGGRKAVLHTPCHQRCSPKLPCICLRHHQKNRNYSIWNPIRFVEISGKDPPH